MSLNPFLSLVEGASVSPRGDDEAVVRRDGWSATLRGLSPAAVHALQGLGDGEFEDRLTDLVLEPDSPATLAKFYRCLAHLDQWRILRRSAVVNGTRFATLLAISPWFRYTPHQPDPAKVYQLSRFVYARAQDGNFVVESPLSHARVVLHDSRAAALLNDLARPGKILHERCGSLSSNEATQIIALLLCAGMLTEVEDSGQTCEDLNDALRCWEFHDLLFHARSRMGRHDLPSGGTFRLAGHLAPTPAVAPARAAEVIALPTPDLEQARLSDPPFAAVQDARHSIRAYDKKPITLPQVSEFLYRVARIIECRRLQVQTGKGAIDIEVARRPYPTAGAMNELEVYLAVKACDGLEQGLYHYDGGHHHLENISGVSPAMNELLAGASWSSDIPQQDLQILILITARFQRLSWKYAAMAYAVMLKDVGVLIQTMYLVATAMGIAPCAIGCGDSDLCARALGTDYYSETSVGEFLLGSKRRDR